jgi:hypothetical protein
MFKHELGAKGRSYATGVEGIIVNRAEALYGCNRYLLQPRVAADGKLPDGYWFDEDDVEVVEAPARKVEPKKTGGPISKKC